MNIKYRKIFIMTMPRSGSTLLGQVLAGHNAVFHMGELAYWGLLNPNKNRCSCGKNICPFLLKVGKRIQEKNLANPLLKVWEITDKKFWPKKPVGEDTVVQDKSTINKRSFNYWLSRCPKSLNNIIEIYKNYSNKEIYIDNTKLYNIGKRLAGKNDWGIIVLIRDPRGIMSSYKNAGIRKGDFRTAESVLPFCYNFIKSAQEIKDIKNVLIIRYEDFCQAPVNILNSICKFIGINYQNSMLDFNNKNSQMRSHVLKGNYLLYGNANINIREGNDDWKNNLTKKELNKLYNNKKLIKLYSNFGYFHE